MSLHRVAFISKVYHWISAHVLKVQVLKIFFNVVKNYNVYSCKIPVKFKKNNRIFSAFLCLSTSIGIEDNSMLAVDWQTSLVHELDISSTELTESCLLDIFSRFPKLSYLAVPNCDGFTDRVNKGIRLAIFRLNWSIEGFGTADWWRQIKQSSSHWFE